MDDIRAKLDEFDSRLRALELWAGIRTESPAAPPLPPYQPDSLASPAPVAIQSSGRSFEETIGRWWLGVVGVIAIVFGVSFFLKYAFENNLIGVTGRVALGFIGGLSLVALGEGLRSRWEKYSQLLTGAGLALFYLTTYAAFAYYDLIGHPTAFAFMCLITAFGMALSLVGDAVGVAALAVAGGFLTPALLSTGVAQDVSLFLYLMVLNLGVLAVSFFKKWNELILLGFIGTLVNFTSWYASYYQDEKLAFAIYVLTIFFLIYILSSVVANWMSDRQSGSRDLAILTINPVWYFSWLYYLLSPRHVTLGFTAAALAVIYLVLAYLTIQWRRDNERLTLFLAAISLLFTTMAIPLLFDQNAITIAWAAEAAILYAIGIRLDVVKVRLVSFAVLGVAVVRLLALDSDVAFGAHFYPLFNRRFLTYGTIVVASSVMGLLAIRHASSLQAAEWGTRPVLWLLANALLIIGITMDINSFAAARQEALRLRLASDIRLRTPVTEQYQYGQDDCTRYDCVREINSVYATPEYRSIHNQKNAATSVFWTLYAIVLISAGIMLRHAYLRWAALGLLGVTVIKVFTVDLAGLETLYRIISFMVLGCILLAASFMYFRYEQRLGNPTQ